MYQIKQSICYPGFKAKTNEDAVGYGKDYCFVMDGASCLSGQNIMHPLSDAAWMTGMIKDGLCAMLDAGDQRPTKVLLKEVIAPIRDEYISALRKQGIAAPQDSPSAGFVLFRQRDGKLEFFGLGDCVGVASFADGTRFYSLDSCLPSLDQQVLDCMLEIHKTTGIPMKEARLQCNDLLLKNRNLRNTPEGYWILDLLTDDGIENAAEFCWELGAPVCVGAFSDGFAQLAEVFRQYPDYNALFDAMQRKDLDELFSELCSLQDADDDLNDFPRFKLRDDTSALWGIFTP